MTAKLDPATIAWCANYMIDLEQQESLGHTGGTSAAERIASGTRSMMAQEVASYFRSLVPAQSTRVFSEWDARARYAPELASKAGIVAAALIHYLSEYANDNNLAADAWFTILAAEISAALGISERRITVACALMVKIGFLEVRYEGPNNRRFFCVSMTARSVLR